MKESAIEQQMKLVNKVLNMLIKDEFPEIYEIKLEDKGYYLDIHILVDGTDEEQEYEIEEAVQNALKYIGDDINYGISFHVENWGWEKEN
jgi:putative lipoic acid-binding regulatory protein